MATTPCHAPADHGDDDGDHGGGDEDNGDDGDGGGGDDSDGVGGGDDDNKDKDDAGIMHLPAHTFKKGSSILTSLGKKAFLTVCESRRTFW